MSLTRKLLNREAFMGLFIAGTAGFFSLLAAIPILGFVFSPLIRQPTWTWADVGAVSDFTVGKMVAVVYNYPSFGTAQWSGPTQKTKAWLRRTGTDTFQAFAVYCTHLGCPVYWEADPQIFLCPCHGSVFNGDGTVAGGPAPRSLFQYQVRVRNGRVEIKTEAQPVVT